MRPKTRERIPSSTFIILSKFSDSELLEFLSRPSPYQTVIHRTRLSMTMMPKATAEVEDTIRENSEKDVVNMETDEDGHLVDFGTCSRREAIRDVTRIEVDEFLRTRSAFEKTPDGWLYIPSRG